MTLRVFYSPGLNAVIVAVTIVEAAVMAGISAEELTEINLETPNVLLRARR